MLPLILGILIGLSSCAGQSDFGLSDPEQNLKITSRRNPTVDDYASVYVYCSEDHTICQNIKIEDNSIGPLVPGEYARLSLVEDQYELNALYAGASDTISKHFKAGEDYYYSIKANRAPGPLVIQELTTGGYALSAIFTLGLSTYILPLPQWVEIEELDQNRGRQFVQTAEMKVAENYAFLPSHVSEDEPFDDGSTQLAEDNEKLQDTDLYHRLQDQESRPADPNRYAVAIGIQDYNEAPDVPHASMTSDFFQQLATKQMGVPKENVIHIPGNEATAGVIRGRLSTLFNRLDSDDTLYFYYAGHGVPGSAGESAYLLPRDAVVGAYEDPDFKLSSIYERIEESGVGRAYAFIDACFSGQSSPTEQIFEGVAPAGRTVQSMDQKRIPENMTVMTAGASDQFANEYEEKNSRLFSYFLMRGIMEGKEGNELIRYVRSNVDKQSRIKGKAYTQTPQIYGKATIDF